MGVFTYRRGDAVHRDAEGGRLRGEGEGEPDHRALRHRIGSARGYSAALRRDGGDVDDPAPASFLHPGHAGPAEVEGAVQVHGQHPVPLVRRGVRELVPGEDPRVVHQDVDRSELASDPLDGAAARQGIGDVEGDGGEPVRSSRRRRLPGQPAPGPGHRGRPWPPGHRRRAVQRPPPCPWFRPHRSPVPSFVPARLLHSSRLSPSPNPGSVRRS